MLLCGVVPNLGLMLISLLSVQSLRHGSASTAVSDLLMAPTIGVMLFVMIAAPSHFFGFFQKPCHGVSI